MYFPWILGLMEPELLCVSRDFGPHETQNDCVSRDFGHHGAKTVWKGDLVIMEPKTT